MSPSLADSLVAVTRFHEKFEPRRQEILELCRSDLMTTAELAKFISETQEARDFKYAHWSRGKCSETSEQFKADSSAALAECCFSRALSCINSAIIWVKPPPSDYDSAKQTEPTKLALLHECRAMIMARMGRFQDALTEMERAKRTGYPDSQQHRLLRKRAECLVRMGQVLTAKKTLEEALHKVSTQIALAGSARSDPQADIGTLATLEQEKFEYQSFMSSLNYSCEYLSHGCTDCNFSNTGARFCSRHMTGVMPTEDQPVLHDLPNPNEPSVSVAVNGSSDGFIIAAKNIRPGDILIVENPRTTVLYPEVWWSRCHQCLKRCDLPIPCKGCSMAVFCSDPCLKDASSYHKYECGIMGTLSEATFRGTPLLAMRVITSIGPSALTPDTSIHRSFCELVSMLGSKNGSGFADPDAAYVAAINSVFLANTLLAATDFGVSVLGSQTSEESTKVLKLMCTEALLELLKVLPVNENLITELVSRPTVNWLIQSSYETVIGSCVAPVTRSCKLSCFPNCHQRFQNGKIVVTAILPVKIGEQLTIAMAGRDFLETKKPNRLLVQKQISPRITSCDCVACVEDWPCIAEMCPSVFQVKCCKCQTLLPDAPETEELAAKNATEDSQHAENLSAGDTGNNNESNKHSCPFDDHQDETISRGSMITNCPNCSAPTLQMEKNIQHFLDNLDCQHYGVVTGLADYETEKFFENVLSDLTPIMFYPKCRRFFVAYRSLQRIHAMRGFNYTYSSS